VPPNRSARRPTERPTTTVGRAERHGLVLCPAVLVVVHGRPGTLGREPRDDLTAWFYGALHPSLEHDLETLADPATDPVVDPLDLVLQVPGGELDLSGCRLRPPVRIAGPASTLEFRVSHPGAQAEQQSLWAAYWAA
jgi:hypothetical protein